MRSAAGGTTPGVFSIAFRPHGPVAGEDAWFGIQEVLDDLRQNGPSAKELQTSKRNWQRQQALSQTKVESIAKDLARWEQSVGVPAFGGTYREAVGGLSVDNVKRVVATYLHPKGANLSRVSVVPTKPPVNGEQSSQTTNGERSTLTDVALKQETLPFGAQIIHRYMSIGLAHVRLTMKAGSSIEEEEFLGASNLLAELLQAGSTNRRGADFKALLNELGMQFSVQAPPHHLELHIVCFPEDVQQALSLLIDVVKQPALPETALEQAIARQAAAMGQENTNCASHLTARD